MQTRFPAVLTAALALAASALAGCSGGGGTAVARVVHTPALQTNGGRASAHSMVQTSTLTTLLSTGLNVPGGLTPASAIRTMRAVTHGRSISATGTATGACINSQRQSQVKNSDGSTVTTTDLYYDATCTTLENEEIVKITPGADTSTGSGTLVTYDRAGTLTSSHVLTLSEDSSTLGQQITLTDNVSKTVGGTVVATLGATCSGAVNGVSITCSAAHYGTTNSTTTGEAISTKTTVGSGTTQNSTAIGASYYLGALGISDDAGTWSITNASAFNGATGTFTFTSSGNTGSGTITMTDSLYTYSESGTLSSSGLSVTIIENPNPSEGVTAVTPIATVAVDAGGNGTLSYADGTSEAIWGTVVGL